MKFSFALAIPLYILFFSILFDGRNEGGWKAWSVRVQENGNPATTSL